VIQIQRLKNGWRKDATEEVLGMANIGEDGFEEGVVWAGHRENITRLYSYE
jgi:hypothetical protein